MGDGATIVRAAATATLSAAPTFGASVNVIYSAGALTTGAEIPTSAAMK